MFEFIIKDVNFKIYLEKPFPESEQYILYLDRKISEHAWESLLYPTIYPADIDNTEKCDNFFKDLILRINEKLVEIFNKDKVIPEKGIERIKFIIENLLRIEDDKLVSDFE